jgi:type III secretion protein S
MNYDDLIQMTTQGLCLVLLISLPITAVAATVGLLVSLFQAVTSLQDQSISQGMKLLIVTLVIFFTAPWASALVLAYAQRALLGASG